jgi:hypothetical protein
VESGAATTAPETGDYCGTSVEMIERHYGRFMQADAGQLALLTPDTSPGSLRAVGGATFGATFSGTRKDVSAARRRGGDSNAEATKSGHAEKCREIQRN